MKLACKCSQTSNRLRTQKGVTRGLTLQFFARQVYKSHTTKKRDLAAA